MTDDPFDLVLSGGTLVTPAGRLEADLGIRDGRIAAIGALGRVPAAERRPVRGLHVLPGVIDSQVHFREPGLEHKEDLETGARGAVLGGVTTVFEMPNTKPATTTAEAIADKLARAKGRMWCEHAFYIGAAAENAAELPALERLAGTCGVKIFMGSSTGSLLVSEDEVLDTVLSGLRRRCAVHAEDEPRLIERKGLAEAGRVGTHPVWRDAETAIRATRRLIAIARRHQALVHVLHVTTAEEIALLGAHKDIATVEVTPQHLTLAAPECYERLGTRAQMNPPIREARHQAGLWAGIADGTVDVLGSDHAPHTLEEKGRAYPGTPSGMTGVQTLVPVMLTHVAEGRLSLERFVDLTAHGPQRVFGLVGKGRLAVGWDADLTIVDLGARREITDGWIASRSGWTPFAGLQARGWPVMTLIRGQTVMREDTLLGTPIGAPVRFQSTLRALA
ncbi:MAG: dihydroorotase [Alphaproteobacteria bacterium]|nr:dihydroorotase [Alphaproteobacteria bacterium]